MFEFSTTSIIIIAVCVIAIILLLFLYLYIGRREKQGIMSTEEEPAPADEQVWKPVEADRETDPAEADVPQPVQTAVPVHSSDEELAASVEAALAEMDSVSAADAEPATEPVAAAEPTAAPDPTTEPEAAPEPTAAPETAAEPISEPEAVVVSEPEKPEKPAKQKEPDLSALYQEVDEEDYEQVGTDVADAIALAFEKAIKPGSAADGQFLQQAAAGSEGSSQFTQTAGTNRSAAGLHIRGRIVNDETPVSQENNINGEMPVGAHRTAAPGSVRKRRGSGR